VPSTTPFASRRETVNRLVYDLGNGQWDIPVLRKMLDDVLSRSQFVHDYEVEHAFPALGRRSILLNARPFPPDSKHPELILLAVEDVSDVRLVELWPVPPAPCEQANLKRVVQRPVQNKPVVAFVRSDAPLRLPIRPRAG